MNWNESHEMSDATKSKDWGKVEKSGVARRQVEATKYVEFRNVAASFFTWYV